MDFCLNRVIKYILLSFYFLATKEHLIISNIMASLVAQTVKNLPAMWETRVWSLGQEDPLAKRMTTHSSILAWRIPWTEEPGVLYRPRGWKELDTTEQLIHILCLTFTWETEQKQISSVPGLGECLCSKGTNKFSWLLYFLPLWNMWFLCP